MTPISPISIAAALSALVLLLMLRRGLVRHLPWFAISLAIQMAQMGVLAQRSYGSPEYFYAWFAGERALLASIGLAGLEIYLQFNRAIYRAGRVGLFILGAAVIVGSTVALSTPPVTSAEWSAAMAGLLGAKRTLLTALAAGLAAVLWFYRRFSIPVASFVRPHSRIFLVYVASHATGLWLAEASGSRWLGWINQATILIWSGCLAAWMGYFWRDVKFPHPPSAADVAKAETRAQRLDRLVGQ